MKGAKTNTSSTLPPEITSLSNKLNNFITFVLVCVNTTKAFDFQSLGRPFVFSALACKVWCLSMLFKPPYVGLVLHPHHPLSLPQCSFFLISVSHPSISPWSCFYFRAVPGKFSPEEMEQLDFSHLCTGIKAKGPRLDISKFPNTCFEPSKRLQKGTEMFSFFPHQFVRPQNIFFKRHDFILIMNSYFFKGTIPQLVLALGSFPKLIELLIYKT